MAEFAKEDLDFLYPRRLGGGQRNRKSETEANYRRRYKWLQQRANAEFDGSLDAYRCARWVAGMAGALRASSYRQYQAAILQWFRDLADEGILCVAEARVAVLVLRMAERRHRANKRAGEPDRCGSGRAKQLSKDEQKALVLAVRNRKRQTLAARVLGTILVFGPMLGLRPWEWGGAVVDGHNLLVRSAKFSPENGTGLEPVRELRLDHTVLKDAARTHLDQLLRDLREQVDAVGKERIMRRVSRLLARIRGVAGAPRATLKTTRHQARSNLRAAGVSDAEIAVLFGHASAATAQAHYGVRRGGWKVKVAVSAAPEMMERVRKVPGRRRAEKMPDMSDAIQPLRFDPW